MNIFNMLVTRPFGYLLTQIYNAVGSYGLSIILFTVVVQVILFPLAIKQQKSTADTARIQPKMKALEKKYKGDREKYSQELMKMYKEEGVNPAAGCLPLLIQLPIIIGLFTVIRRPLSFMFNFTREQIVNIVNVLGMGIEDKMIDQSEIMIAEALKNNINLFPDFSAHNLIDFNFLGINLAATPEFSHPSILWLVPILAAATSYLSMKVTMKGNAMNMNSGNQKVESMNKSMSVMMPLMSLWFTFVIPAGVGLYWISSNILIMFRQMLIFKIIPMPEPEKAGKKKEKKNAKDSSKNSKND